MVPWCLMYEPPMAVRVLPEDNKQLLILRLVALCSISLVLFRNYVNDFVSFVGGLSTTARRAMIADSCA